MGFFKNLVTLGGAYFLEKAQKRYEACAQEYERITASLDYANQEIEATTGNLRKSFLRTKQNLLRAHQIIAPRCLLNSPRGLHNSPIVEEGSRGLSTSRKSRDVWEGASSTQLAIGSAAIGTSTAILAWQGAQIIGFASTGTAMLGLHGAAASNAGWALFGGGSLATGGGGMALGHLVLPGIGVAVALGFGAYSTYSKAGEFDRASSEVEQANEKNRLTLSRVNSDVARLRRACGIYECADDELKLAVKTASRKLRRFGFLTTLFRFVRYKVTGVYYSVEELRFVRRLEDAVESFMVAVGAEIK